jgi:flagellar motor switch protein FliG
MLDRDLRIAVNALIDSMKENDLNGMEQSMSMLNQLLGNETAEKLYDRIKKCYLRVNYVD